MVHGRCDCKKRKGRSNQGKTLILQSSMSVTSAKFHTGWPAISVRMWWPMVFCSKAAVLSETDAIVIIVNESHAPLFSLASFVRCFSASHTNEAGEVVSANVAR